MALPGGDETDSPPRYMCAHQRLEHPPMGWKAEMQQLMDNYVILETLILLDQIGGQGTKVCIGYRAPSESTSRHTVLRIFDVSSKPTHT